MKRKYNFDKIEEIGDILGMSLYWNGTAYIDYASGEKPEDCDQYFDWQIVQLLDELSDESVVSILC